MSNIHVSVISGERNLCSKLIKEVLSTHNDISDKDIEWASDIISKSRLSDLSDKEQMAMFLLHSNKETNIGKFSLCFNRILDDIIIDRNYKDLYNILNINSKDAFKELYDNIDLTENEQNCILKMYERELLVTLNVIEESIGKCSPEIDLQKLLVCPTEKLSMTTNHDNGDYSETSIYTKCYKGVCMYEQRNEKTEDLQFDISLNPPSVVFTSELSEHNIKNAYCFDFMTLINAISKEPAINPTTNKPFREETVRMLRARYHKEVSMYKYYLDRFQ